eukprot:COSAG01_NODE_10803_length_2076_cov_39.969145_2_plen_81_part_00
MGDQPDDGPPPGQMLPEVAEMISQCAEYVVAFGPSFEQLLRSKNRHELGWEFLFEKQTAEAKYYEAALTTARQKLKRNGI